jgi:hypothetical protein
MYEDLGAAMWDANRPLFERDLATARAQLDEEDWRKAWQEGKGMSMEQAIAYAMEES